MSSVPGLTVLVLAGTRAGGDPLAVHAGVSHKALIEIGGCTMIERVVGALAEVPEIARIVIAIDRSEVLEPLAGLQALQAPRCTTALETMPSAAGPSASVAAALKTFGTPLLVTTADHALLQPDWVQDFLAACPAELDVVVAMARKASVLAAVPATQRTYLRFADGEFSGCNLFYLQHAAAARVIDFWQQLETERKQPLRMMRRLGFGFALRYRCGWLQLNQALAQLGRRAGGARLGVVDLADGRAAIDVDKPADLELVRTLLADDAQRADARSISAG